MYQIKRSPAFFTDPFFGAVSKLIHAELPLSSKVNAKEHLDLVSGEIFGTKNTRFGPLPSPEIMTNMREVMRHYIARDEPIPFIVPWGSSKAGTGTDIDIAEVMGLKTMFCMHQRVAAHYKPGLLFNVRLTDASKPHLYIQDTNAWEKADKYSGDFVNLVKVLGLESVIHPVRESWSISAADFAKEADIVLEGMEPYIKQVVQHGAHVSGPEWDAVQALGWKGNISMEIVNYYLHRYKTLYPNDSAERHQHILARYFSASLTRARLKLRADDPSWAGKFLDLSFTPPIPGTEEFFTRRIHYRTMPTTLTGNHIPAWRAKGYIKIENNEAHPKLASFFDKIEYNPLTVLLADEMAGLSVEVRADYVLAD